MFFFSIDWWWVSTLVVPVLLAITLHEAAHAWVAWKLGDDTAYRRGRVSFNPFRHIDLVGTVIIPAALIFLRVPFVFGYAKPVPVRFGNLRRPRRHMVYVSAAGPGANVIIALAAGVLLHLAPFAPGQAADWFNESLRLAITVNLFFAVLNMIPVPPLDGGRVAVGLLPRALAARLARTERFGLPVLLVALIALPLVTGGAINPLQTIVWPIVGALYNVVSFVTGHI